MSDAPLETSPEKSRETGIQESDVLAALCRNEQASMGRLLEHLLCDPALGLREETVALFSRDGRVAETFLGRQNQALLAMPAELAEAEFFEVLADLRVLASRASLGAGQELEVRKDGDRWLLVNKTRRGEPAHTPGEGATGSTWRRTGNFPPPERTARSAERIGIISHCASPADLAVLEGTLRAWVENMSVFGHRLPVCVCDDSDSEYGEQVRDLAAELREHEGLDIRVVGREEKRWLGELLVLGVAGSPRARELMAAEGYTVARLQRMIVDVFGGFDESGRYHSGATQNRNLSNLLASGRRAFQADHDHRPRAVTHKADQIRRLFFEEYGLPIPQRLRAAVIPETLKQGDTDVAVVDLLTLQARAPAAAIASARFSGARDQSILRIVARPRRPDAASFGLPSFSSRDPHEPERFVAWEAFDRMPTGESPQLSAAMFLPDRYGGGRDFVPWAPPVRNGDILLGECMELQSGLKPSQLAAIVEHASLAGENSRWGGSYRLWRDDLFSNAVAEALRVVAATAASPAGHGRALLNGLGEEFGSALALQFRIPVQGQSVDTAGVVLLTHRATLAGLQASQTQMASGEPEQVAHAITDWYFAAEIEAAQISRSDALERASKLRQEPHRVRCMIDDVQQAIDVEQAEIRSWEQVTGAREDNRYPEAAANRALFYTTMLEQARSLVESYAISLVLADEILDQAEDLRARLERGASG